MTTIPWSPPAFTRMMFHCGIAEIRWSRHPSYVGFFYWAIATQLVLGNVVSTLAFAVVLGRFFSARIRGKFATSKAADSQTRRGTSFGSLGTSMCSTVGEWARVYHPWPRNLEHHAVLWTLRTPFLLRPLHTCSSFCHRLLIFAAPFFRADLPHSDILAPHSVRILIYKLLVILLLWRL